MLHLADPNNPIMLASEFTLYDASLPLRMKFPGAQFCEDGQIMLLVGRVPEDSKAPLEVIFRGEEDKEAFHVLVDPRRNFIQRWAVPVNVTEGLTGEPGEGTTIDLDEPFLFRFGPVSVFIGLMTSGSGVMGTAGWSFLTRNLPILTSSTYSVLSISLLF